MIGVVSLGTLFSVALALASGGLLSCLDAAFDWLAGYFDDLDLERDFLELCWASSSPMVFYAAASLVYSANLDAAASHADS